MELFDIVLILAALLCALVAGFLFAFAVVAMPGIKRLDDGAFIRAFQGMDRIIQENQPLFMLVWVGSVLALIGAAVLGFWELEGEALVLLLGAALVYLLGVQLPTIAVNIPLNNQIQALDVETMDNEARRAARAAFEPRWNRWNEIRAALSCLAALLLMIVLLLR